MRAQIAVVVGLCLSLLVPDGASAQDSFLYRLSPQALTDLIASARPDTPVDLTVFNRRITVLRASVLGRSSAGRVDAVRQLVDAMTADSQPLTVTSRVVQTAAVISVGGRDLFAIVPTDIDPLLGETVETNTADAAARLQQALDEMTEASRPRVVMWGLAQAVLATLAFAALVWGLWRENKRASAAAGRITERKLSTLPVGGEIVRESRLLDYVRRGIGVVLFVIGLSFAYQWLTFVLRRFPYTRPWGESLRTLLVAQVSSFGEGVVAALPNLFAITLIVLVTRFAIRFVRLVFAAVEEQRLSLPWTYPETAATTRKLVTGLLWLFALIVAYPYVPGSSTDAFKGVSVFVGVIVSLGSSGLMNQVMSGFTLTYSRALRRGDYVRVGDIVGTVTQMGTLSTKIETPLREEVTIPNAVLIGSSVTNYSRHAAAGVLVGTEITIGYDAPWRKVEALLLQAADATAGVRRDPAPVVRQKALEDFYVRYALYVSLDDPHRRLPILDRLHANIQDAFNEAGVQIMSPNYEADPSEPKIVPKEQWSR